MGTQFSQYAFRMQGYIIVKRQRGFGNLIENHKDSKYSVDANTEILKLEKPKKDKK